MKAKNALLYSVGSLVAVFVLLVAINVVSGFLRLRMDLTEERAFTLSEGTRRILSNLDGPVQLRLYVGSADGAMPPFLKNYASRVEDLLHEMSVASGGKLQVTKLDPKPDSDAEESARMDGIEGQPLPNGDVLTLGISVNMLDQKMAIPFLTPEREPILEYDIARAISQVSKETKPVIGIMSPLPVMGQPMAMMMRGGQGPQPWVLVDELRRDFDVRDVGMGAASIPEDLSTLVVIHPKEITPQAEYAIDQFLLRGGRLLVFLDPYCIFDGGFGQMPVGSSSTLPTLLPAWGLSFNDHQAVADLQFEGRTREGRAPALLDLTTQALNPDDVLTASVDSMLMAFAGTYSGEPAEGLTKEVLIHSSETSQLVDPMVARMSPEQVIRNFQASDTEMPLAVRLTGRFKSAFPEGRPVGESQQEPDSGEHLSESQQESSVVLIGDADMIQDPLAVTEVRGMFPGGRLLVPTNGNLGFAQGAVEQLSGDSDLITVRSRAIRNRPFTLVRGMQAAAEQRFQDTIRELEASLQEAQTRLTQLQQGKEEGQRFILSAEQQREIEAFRAKEAEVRKQLKEVRRELRAEIDSLETRLKWLNIAAIPALVVVGGIAFGIWKRRNSRAR